MILKKCNDSTDSMKNTEFVTEKQGKQFLHQLKNGVCDSRYLLAHFTRGQ